MTDKPTGHEPSAVFADRDDLAALIEWAIFGSPHEPHAVRSGLRAADAVLAAGWRAPEPPIDLMQVLSPDHPLVNESERSWRK